MKTCFSIIPLIILVAFLFIKPLSSTAQQPGMGIFFQAIAKDKMGNPANGRNVYVQTSIVNSSLNSSAILTELHQSKSNENGIFSLSIGQGNRIGGTASNLSSIPWGNGPLSLNVKIAIEPLSPLNNWDYTKEWIDLGITPFGTVPYALYAGNGSGNGSSNDTKLNISDTASMLAPYSKAVATLIKNTISPLGVLDSVNQKIQYKVNVMDSNIVYVTPYQLASKTFDTSFLSRSINNKLSISDTANLLSPYSKQDQVYSSLNLKLNIADTALMMTNRIARDTISLSDRINVKLNLSDTAFMLSNYVKTNNLNNLAFTGDYNDLINKPPVVNYIVNTVNGLSGDVLINKNTMEIANVDNTSDANKPISILTNTALNNKIDKASINTANGIPSLDANTKIPSNLLPAISFTSVTIANSPAQMQSIGSTSLKGTVAVRTDISKTYILSVDNSSNINDWVEILNPGAPVQSVNGKLANVSLTTSDITEGISEYFTQNKARLALTANSPINYNAASGLLSADTSTSNYSLVTKYALQQQIAKDTISLSNRINLKEISTNKSTDINLDAASIVKFPTTSAVKRYVDSVAIVLNSNIVASNTAIVLPDASSFTKGILKLAGDLTGAANAPVIANDAINTDKIINDAITTAKVIDAAITDSKIAFGINASKVGLGNVSNTADLNKPISTLTQDALNLKLNSSDTAVMLSNYLTNLHTTKNLIDTKLNKIDTAAMLSNYLTNIHTTKNSLDTKLNKSDTAAMLSNYLTNIHTTKNLIDTKLNKTDTAAMLSNYLTNMHTTKNALDTKLNKSDTAAMLSNYLTNIHTTKNVLDTKESTANKSNDATLGGISPSATLFPTQSAVKQYIINNTGSGSISATSITGVVAIANGGSGQTTANAAFNALAPSQISNSGKYLTTNGTNTSWASIVTPWSVLGNAGMVDGTNFIGTTDAQPLNFKVNNTSAGRIDVSDVIGQTSFGYGAANNTMKDLNLLNGLKNTAIGYQALNHAYYGKENTAIGYQALVNESSGSGSIAIGFQAMNNMNNTNSYGFISSQNIGIGYQVMQGSSIQSNNTGINNIAIGYHSMNNIESGANNTAIGTGALYNISTGNYNIALGANSLIFNTTGHYNTALGANSLKYTIGSGNTSIGYGSGNTPTTGTNNTFIGYGADANGGYTNATAIGNGAIVKASNSIVIGNTAIESLSTAGALKTTNATLSSSSLTGALIVAGGAGIGGDINIAGSATISGTTTLNSISYGMTPLTNDNSTKLATTAYVKNVIAGISTSTSSSNGWALTGNTGMVDGTNFIGTTDAQPLNFVANNINSGRIDVAALSGQTSFGYGSGVNTLKNTSNLYGTKNTSIGYQTLLNTVYGKENTAIGYQALYNNNTASGSTAIGFQAMYNAYNISTVTAYSTSNTAIGYQALLGSSTPANNYGISNTAVGHYAEKNNSSGSNNTGVGDLSLYYNTTGQNNTAIGYNTLISIITGSANTAIGYNADVTNNVSNATAIGNGAIANTDNTIQLGNVNVTNVNTSGIYATSNTTESTNSSSGAIVISGGAGIAKNLNVGGSFSVTEANVKHLKGSSATPTYLFGSGAGNTPTNVSFTGTDLSGTITFKTSSGLMANSTIFSLSYATPYSTAPSVVFSPANAASASLYSTQSVWINSNSTYFTINSGSGGLLNSTTYSWNYIVVQ